MSMPVIRQRVLCIAMWAHGKHPTCYYYHKDRFLLYVEAENGKVTPLRKYLRKNKPIRAIF